MHNLHLIVVKAKTGKEACQNVESEIQDFGDENNWRTICGAVAEDDKVYIHDKSGRFLPTKDRNTIAKINTMIKGWLKGSDFYNDEAIKTLKIYLSEKNKPSVIKGIDWCIVRLWAKQKEEEASFRDIYKNNVDVLNMSFYEYEYTEVGVTNMVNVSEEGKLWVVFVDMHS